MKIYQPDRKTVQRCMNGLGGAAAAEKERTCAAAGPSVDGAHLCLFQNRQIKQFLKQQ
jgi:hypothetical protein